VRLVACPEVEDGGTDASYAGQDVAELVDVTLA
jgi:hypothetical protein